MGRRPIVKNRKEKNKKVEQWSLAILPQLKDIDLGRLTIDDLSRLLKKSKSTIYQYFTTKEEFFEYITQTKINYLYSYKEEITKEIFKLDYQYDNLVYIVTEGTKDISSFYLRQLHIHYPAAWKIIEDFLVALLEDLKQFYIFGIEKKFFHPIPPGLLVTLDQCFIMQLIKDGDFFCKTTESIESTIKGYILLKFEGLKNNPANKNMQGYKMIF